MSTIPKRNNDEIDMSRFDIDLMPPPAPPSTSATPPPPLPEKIVVKPLSRTSVKSYTIASLQQYTNSFSQENLIGAGMLGSVYRAELPNGKLLAVKKLDKRVSNQQKDSNLSAWSTILTKFVMLMLLSTWDTAQSMAKGFWSMSIAVMGHCRMLYTQIMTLERNLLGMCALVLELQEH